ncbi:adenylate/guanylate cyclase domain-containing protein [Kiloniella sp. EL199]|uniref:adenylate/guanylate cyclase domain-containing protein n=1 Tax=Kiloniella sp. EL199 TaxID=2107581 RepID=UPI000EA3DD74|nr:adenylate/guanylate cyclase domain-containing protein [Kiloniella sp. EL199]
MSKGKHHTPDLTSDLDQTFNQAQSAGLKLAIAGRTISLLILGAWLVLSRLALPSVSLRFGILVLLLIALGLIHYRIIGTRWDRFWVKYLFVTIDVVILSGLIATQPLYQTADLPQVMIFRSPLLTYYFIIVAVVAFSFSPRLVLWAGGIGAAGWLGAYAWVVRQDGGVLDWGDIPSNPTAQDAISVVLNPSFGGTGSRIQEAIILVVVSVLIAIVMKRAQNTLRDKLTAERDRQSITGIFGRFVPETIVKAMINDQGLLAPLEREATILFADVVGFTNLTERLGPVKIVDVLNSYFDEMTGIIMENGGIVATFHGDAILAIFNVPLEDPDHAEHALKAAQAMLLCVEEDRFAEEKLSIRIGINTGSVVAGNVGGGGRQSYTVYGDAVNLAARLEALAKEKGQSLLISGHTHKKLPQKRLHLLGETTVRGQSQPVEFYGLK